MTAQRPFVQWLVLHHGKADTPIGDFAREFAHELPSNASRAELRHRVEYLTGGDFWPLDVFDVAWDMYEPPCSWLGCTKLAAATSPLCPAHELGELL